jgi:hypothetical protein
MLRSGSLSREVVSPDEAEQSPDRMLLRMGIAPKWNHVNYFGRQAEYAADGHGKVSCPELEHSEWFRNDAPVREWCISGGCERPEFLLWFGASAGR